MKLIIQYLFTSVESLHKVINYGLKFWFSTVNRKTEVQTLGSNPPAFHFWLIYHLQTFSYTFLLFQSLPFPCPSYPKLPLFLHFKGWHSWLFQSHKVFITYKKWKQKWFSSSMCTYMVMNARNSLIFCC